MKRIMKVYILYFFINSFAYSAVETFERKMYNRVLAKEFCVGAAVVAVLSVISVLFSEVGVIISERVKDTSKACFLMEAVLVTAMFALIDMLLLYVMTDLISGLCTSLLDRILLTGLCQVVPVELMVDPERFKLR